MSRKWLYVFILLGLTSLTADMVYEGGRSVGGSYIEFLGGSAIASAIASSGDLIGYGLRFVSAFLASVFASSAIFWGFTIFGYAITALSIPLLSYASSWQWATTLILLERVGKGIRSPVRDVILAEVSEKIGRGKGFGIHELMDQIGAVGGPVIVSVVLAFYGYRVAFAALLIPGVASIAFILTSYALYPTIKAVEISPPRIGFRGMGKRFWIYIASMTFLSLGYIHWMVISYYLRYWNVLTDAEIALAYMLAMLTDAAIAVPIGVMYDKLKFRSLYIAPPSALGAALILLLNAANPNKIMAYVSAALWGVTMGCFETIMRASIADILPPERRAMGYGIFGLIYGISWTVGAFVFVFLLQTSITFAATYVVLMQCLSIALLTMI
ncbi:MFS transporter [Ignisphaera sp. 4213-co]|uniref:MFS transporter n=1 Tax=Ignisphaera cupida TaxID=3050454 RepID=A0ABD4Z7Y2_9CREN|nr:MFS transporter [Ignisphaera sp. 4213-co]MDK6029038.1 MFS transporter [Ignisphaera sp. 4213-co]